MLNDVATSAKASADSRVSENETAQPEQLRTSTLFVAWFFAGPLNPLWLAIFYGMTGYEGSDIAYSVAKASPFFSGVTAFIAVMLISHKADPSYNMIWRTWLKVYTPIGLFVFSVFAIVLFCNLFFLALFALPVVALVISGFGLAISLSGALVMHLVFRVMEPR